MGRRGREGCAWAATIRQAMLHAPPDNTGPSQLSPPGPDLGRGRARTAGHARSKQSARLFAFLRAIHRAHHPLALALASNPLALALVFYPLALALASNPLALSLVPTP
eukprot:scaffold28_cov101-Isochrysis_galbana.AAC.2